MRLRFRFRRRMRFFFHFPRICETPTEGAKRKTPTQGTIHHHTRALEQTLGSQMKQLPVRKTDKPTGGASMTTSTRCHLMATDAP